jgi:8-oxo-dGTP pyrophosphatase MutT (NUDIX family)
MTPPVDGTLALLRTFPPPEEGLAADAFARTVELLGRGAAAFDRRRYDPGHVTASALVLSAGGGVVLLVRHPRLGRWLQPGGHIEPGDSSVIAAARRETLEETGLVLGAVEPTLVAVDVHEIPRGRGEPAHEHHDLMFAFAADSDIRPVGREPARWWPVKDARRLVSDAALHRGLDRALGTTTPHTW